MQLYLLLFKKDCSIHDLETEVQETNEGTEQEPIDVDFTKERQPEPTNQMVLCYVPYRIFKTRENYYIHCRSL